MDYEAKLGPSALDRAIEVAGKLKIRERDAYQEMMDAQKEYHAVRARASEAAQEVERLAKDAVRKVAEGQ